MNHILMLAAAAAQAAACPPVAELSKIPPVELRVHPDLPKKLVDKGVRLKKGDTLASTVYLLVDSVPTSFHVIRSADGLTRLYGLCAAPWGEMLCAKQEFRGKEHSPDIFVRKRGDIVILVIRFQDAGRRRYQVYRLDQLTGFQKKCG